MDSLEKIEAAPELEFVVFRSIEPPRVTFFYERLDTNYKSDYDGESLDEQLQYDGKRIFACDEQQAAQLDAKPHRFRQVGHSDGKVFYDTMKGSGLKIGQRISVSQARDLQVKAYQAELDVARGNRRKPKAVHSFFPDNSVPDHIKATIGHG